MAALYLPKVQILQDLPVTFLLPHPITTVCAQEETETDAL